jgi:hypothetical protein
MRERRKGINRLDRSRNRIPEVLHVGVLSAWRTLIITARAACSANVAPTAEPVGAWPGIPEPPLRAMRHPELACTYPPVSGEGSIRRRLAVFSGDSPDADVPLRPIERADATWGVPIALLQLALLQRETARHGREEQESRTAATLPVLPVDRHGPHRGTLRNAELLLSRLLTFMGYDPTPVVVILSTQTGHQLDIF